MPKKIQLVRLAPICAGARRCVAVFLSAALAWGNANACSRSFGVDLEFEAGSADLRTRETVKLFNSIDKWRKEAMHLNHVEVDGMAPEDAADALRLAQRRSDVASRALGMLLDGVPVHATAHLAPSALSDHNGGNYVAIELVPLTDDRVGCSAVPPRDLVR